MAVKKRIMHKRYFLFYISILFFLLSVFPAAAESNGKTNLLLTILTPGTILLDGDIAVDDRVRVYSREYRSAEHRITDKLLADMTSGTDNSITFSYSFYSDPIEEITNVPDFEYDGRDIEIKALYAVVSNGTSEIFSNFVYTDCTLDTGVVNQYWCSLAPSTACGTAAAVVAMQIAYPSSGDDLFLRLNKMRNYGISGSDFSTGPAEYYLNWDHINNAVDKFVSEELHGDLIMIDHRPEAESTEKKLIELLSTGRPAVIEVCYLLGNVTRDFQGISHWITINGFSLGTDGYTFRFADSITISYRSISSELLDASNANVSYGNSGYIPVRYIGAFSEPLIIIE